MALAKQRVEIPLGGQSSAAGATHRAPGTAIDVLNMDPIQKGVFRQARGWGTWSIGISAGWLGKYTEGGVRCATRMGEGHYKFGVGARIFDSRNAASWNFAEHYADTLWTTEEISQFAPTDGYASGLTARLLEYSDSQGRPWRVVVTVTESVSTSCRQIVQFYCDGVLIASDSTLIDFGSTNLVHENAARAAVSFDATGAAKRVAVLRPYHSTGTYTISHWDAGNPLGGRTDTAFTTSAGVTGFRAMDICYAPGASGAYDWGIGAQLSDGRVLIERCVSDFGAGHITRWVESSTSTWASKDLRVSGAFDPSTAPSKDRVAITWIETSPDSSWRHRVGVYQAGGTGANRILSTYASPTEITGIDIQPYSAGDGVSQHWIVAVSQADQYTVAGKTRWVYQYCTWLRVMDNGNTAPSVEQTQQLVGGRIHGLTTLGECRVCCSVCAIQAADTFGTYTPAPNIGSVQLYDFGRPEDGWPIPLGSAYINQAWGRGDTRWNYWAQASGAMDRTVRVGLPVFTSDIAIDMTTRRNWAGLVNAAGNQLMARTVGCVYFETGALMHFGGTPNGVAIVPGGLVGITPGSDSGIAATPIAFSWRPKLDITGATGTDSVPAGTYYVRACYELRTSTGLVVRSEPSDVVSYTLASPGSLLITMSHYWAAAPALPISIVLYVSTDGTNFYRLVSGSYTDVANNPYGYYSQVTLRDLQRIGDAVGPDYVMSTEHLYTDGGVLPATQPESAYQCLQWQRRTWLVGGHRQLWYSREHVEGEAPAFNPALTMTIGGERIVAAQPINDKLMIWTDRALYMVAGDGPNDLGEGGFQTPIKVADLTIRAFHPELACAGTASVWFYSTDLNLWQVTIGNGFQTVNRSECFSDWLRGDQGGSAPISSNVLQLTQCPHRRQVRAVISEAAAPLRIYHEDFDIWTSYTYPTGWFAESEALMQASNGLATYTIQENQSSGRYYDTFWSGSTATFASMRSCSYLAGPITLDGSLGSQRVSKAQWLLRTNEYTLINSLVLADSAGGASAWPSASDVVAFYPAAGSQDGHVFSAGWIGGLWECTVKPAHQKGSFVSVYIAAATTADSASLLAAGATVTPFEAHSLTLTVSQRPGRGITTEAQHG